MDVLYPRCCGVDVHKKQVVACLLTLGPAGAPRKAIRTFGTTTDELLRLVDWLQAAECTHVAMESTGVYWKPLYNVCEGLFTVIVANAQHIKAVPGRKTDVRDAEWIADLLQHGLLRPSYIPPQPQQELRELTRYRSTLLRERAAEVNRIQKVLEGANIKLASVASDVLGMSGRAMLEAIVAGTTDPAVLANLARGRLRDKRPALEQALSGRVRPHQRFLLAEQLCHIDALEESIQRVSAEIAERVRPFETEIALLDTIPGVARQGAEALLAEIGPDMSRFPSAHHLASWAGICPGNHESAGKRKSGKTRKGSPWLRSLLVEAAWGASHTKDTYLSAQYRRLAARRGRKKATFALGHSILVSAYPILATRTPYADLGGTYFDERARTSIEHRLIRRLERLGLRVSVEPLLPATGVA
jgi:transposase